MAAVLDPDDSVALHAEDTLTAGAGLCDPAAVSALVSEAPGVISWLSSLGARLGNRHLEGGRSRRRIVHAGDAVGAERPLITEALRGAGAVIVDEVASTGVHGANRLASNSLTEAMIMGRRLGDLLGRELPPGVIPAPSAAGGMGVAPSARPALTAAMSRHAGLLRDEAGLRELLRSLSHAPAGALLDLPTVEATNLHTVSTLVAEAALARRESRGCHRRSDISPCPSTGVAA